MKEIREVWGSNVDSELQFFNQCLEQFNFLSFDTEFPGFLRNTPGMCLSLCYSDLKFNVDLMKIIQLGITLSDGKENICFTWEFNFSDFDLEKDAHAQESIDLLKKSGINFEKIRKDGVSREVFVPKFLRILSRHRNIKWVTFHGLYDLAYVLKLLLNKQTYAKIFIRVCGSGIHGVERKGTTHNAGSDSLLTATVFERMKMMSGFQEEVYSGCLYGISTRIGRRMKMVLPCYSPWMILAPARPPPAAIFRVRPVICAVPIICPVP
ncbi:putative CCR4-associated factor 1 homolog 8 [Mangifera indica]|uniref:putative CCR4-associated factor 1 homolog 8 n=1 Tax=Mangifera indica TaxID=29780 RepID=UPI001CFAAF2C|nr:putative CCR4-associated factor 1 homolog 8 [Mangifera indica]